MGLAGTDGGTVDRWIACAGLANFRDLGGYRTESGGRIRWRHVLRSESLHNLTGEGRVAFEALGVRAIYDLRRHEERAREPGPFPCVHHELPSRRVGDTDPATLQSRRDGERWLLEDYQGMVQHGACAFGRLLTQLADLDGPAVFHCTGGKDRTGITAALLLTCLGVDRQSVLDDYELTARYHGPAHIPAVVDRFVSTGIARAAAEAMLSCPRWAMADALDLLDSEYGGIEAYLHGPCEVRPDTVARVRSRLVD